MKSLTMFLLAVAVAGCAGLGKKLIQEPKVEIESVQVKGVDGKGATVVFDLQIQNPNAFALEVDALKYDVEIAGKRLASGELKSPAKVDANTTSTVSLPIPVKFSDLFASVWALAEKGKSHYVIKGEATFGIIEIPFENQGEITLFK